VTQVNWKVLSSGTDLTSRVRGMRIVQEQSLADIGRLEAVITFDNNDGAFTPNIGGTYSSVDWANQLIEIEADTFTGATYSLVFFGFPYDFVLDDDGTNSTFTIMCIDPFAAFGRCTTDEPSLTPNLPAQPLYLAIENLLNNGTGAKTITGVPAPVPAGATSAAWRVDDDTLSGQGIFQQYNYVEGYYDDVIRNKMLPTGMSMLIPSEWDSSNEEYVLDCVMHGLMRTAGTPVYFGPTTLQAERVITGHNLEQLVNRAALYSSYVTYDDIEATNATSTAKYGPRSIEYTGTVVLWNQAGTPSPSTVRIDHQPYADEWVNRFGDYTYQAVQIQTRYSLQTNQTMRDNFEDLLKLSSLWSFGWVKYTPTGAVAELTDTICIARKQINVTPRDTAVIVDVLPARDFQSFVFDSALLGVLDENRLG